LYLKNIKDTTLSFDHFNIGLKTSTQHSMDYYIISNLKMTYTHKDPFLCLQPGVSLLDVVNKEPYLERNYFNIEPVSISLTAIDLTYLTMITDNITNLKKQLNLSRPFSVPSSETKFNSSVIYSISTGDIRMNINMYAYHDKIMPLIRFGLRNMKLLFNSSPGCKITLPPLQIQPIEVISLQTELWNMLLEPLSFTIDLEFGMQTTKVSVHFPQSCNINISFEALNSIFGFLHEYNERVKNQDINFQHTQPTTVINQTGTSIDVEILNNPQAKISSFNCDNIQKSPANASKNL